MQGDGRTIGSRRLAAAPANHGPYGLIATTVKAATQRLLASRSSGGVWTRAMTALVVAGLASIFLAHFFDRAAIEWARTSGSPLVRWWAAITPAGKFHWYMIPALVVALAAAVSDWPSKSRRGQAGLYLLYSQGSFALWTLVINFLANNLVKIIFGRARPILMNEHGPLHFEPFTTGYAFASFPSGHATACGTVAAILVIWFPRMIVPTLCALSVLAFSRVAAGAHYPSDVVCGLFCGFIATLFMARWLAARRLGFRLEPNRLLPRIRFAHSLG